MNGRTRSPRVRPFILAKYLGSEEDEIPAPYTAQQLIVMGAGALGLLAALQVRRRASMHRVAVAVSEHNRRRFHAAPNK